ncbi:uncharacterized protein BJ171DRAFT_559023 [Polychytrium aggregatum]|uniref:uncharacterized protein n=1 Tax=Polychytrium aggregatum TaxID=110093 RepID=UPI0022FE9FCF|nr:uncharacterized protein BJ171DRAFT_559023 [Polychytrium aggregatum]KAI9202861.1 hypothetical protein BJ171DRAFT_559023 [Polychytrium aggregatum]
MSFDIQWDKLDSGVAKNLQDFLNKHFEHLTRPSFIGPISIIDLDFGTIPPNIEIKDITDPLTEFYLPDEDDLDLQHGSGPLDDFDSRADRGFPLPSDVAVVASPGHPHPERNMWPDTMISEDLMIQQAESLKRETDAQVELLVEYKGNMRLSISTELIVNHPTPNFMVLPLTLSLTGFAFSGTLLIAYLGTRINICFQEPESGKSLLQDVFIESEIGDKNRQVLKNVSKIERFIVEQLRKFIDDNLVFPNFHSLDLLGADEEDTPSHRDDLDDFDFD